jgi:hypothetical protein
LESRKQKFVIYANFWIDAGSSRFAKTFSDELYFVFVRPLIIEAAVDDALRTSLYTLSLLTAPPLTLPIIKFLETTLPSCFDSTSSNTCLLGIRCLTLLLDHTIPNLSSASDSSKRSPSLMRLLPGEWFVFPDLNAHIEQARAQVGASMSAKKTIRASIPFDLISILPKIQALFGQFFENKLAINLALTEFFATLLIVAHGAFTEFSDLGLYAMLEAVCTIAKRRIGVKDGTIENIKIAYRELNGERVVEGESIFVPVVVLLEFLKELNSISQSWALLMSQEATVGD